MKHLCSFYGPNSLFSFVVQHISAAPSALLRMLQLNSHKLASLELSEKTKDVLFTSVRFFKAINKWLKALQVSTERARTRFSCTGAEMVWCRELTAQWKIPGEDCLGGDLDFNGCHLRLRAIVNNGRGACWEKWRVQIPHLGLNS